MKLELIITSDAYLDLGQIVEWYEARKRYLGIEFAEIANEYINRIGKNPLLYNCVYKDYRRALLKRFPYKIYYKVVENKILIIGMFHNSRDTKTIFDILDRR